VSRYLVADSCRRHRRDSGTQLDPDEELLGYHEAIAERATAIGRAIGLARQCDTVLIATPIDLGHVLTIDKPSIA